MTKSDNRMLWIRNLESVIGANKSNTIDVELGSETLINGLLVYKDDESILFANTSHIPDKAGLYKYIMRIKTFVFQLVKPTQNASDDGYIFPGSAIDELVALTSLFMQTRLYVLSITQGQLTKQSLPFKTEFSTLRNDFGAGVDPVVFSKADRPFYKLTNFLNQICLMPEKYHLPVALAANHYALALREIGVNKEMVFIRLVAAIETVAFEQKISNDPLSSKKLEELFQRENVTDKPDAQIFEELKKLWKNRKAKARFVDFIEHYSLGFFDTMPDKATRTQVTPKNLASVAKAIYDARSDYIHNGIPMYISHHDPNFPEWHMDQSLGMTWHNRIYEEKQKLPTAVFFHQLVRHCLLKYLNSIAPYSGRRLKKESVGWVEE